MAKKAGILSALVSVSGFQCFSNEAIAKPSPNRQNAASEGEERRRSVVTKLSLSDEAIAPHHEGGWDESFALASITIATTKVKLSILGQDCTLCDSSLATFERVPFFSNQSRFFRKKVFSQALHT